MAEFVGIEITKALPEDALVGYKYTIKGNVKIFNAVGAPPFVYAEVKYKEWLKPDWAEDKDYLRAWPMPITGSFSIDFKPEKEGEYEVKVLATPALLSLPVVGLVPVLAESDPMKLSIRKQVIDFDLIKPTVEPSQISPGDSITITCQVTSTSEESQTLTAKVKIYEGSALPTHGTLITTKTSPAFTIAPGQSYDIVVAHTAVQGTIDRRDIGIELYIGDAKVKDAEWDDVYYVTPETIDFTLDQPSASPAQVSPGQTVTITCPVTSKCTKSQTVTAKVLIYEGSALSGHGTLITTVTSPAFTIEPGQEYEVIIHHTADAGTIDRRDVGVQIVLSGKVVAEDEWDDVFYVTAEAEEIAFDLSQPTTNPSQVSPGATVDITCPVTSNSTNVQSVTANIKIYEGSILSGHGTLLSTKSVSFSISPGQTYNAVVTDVAVAGSIDRRDVGVEIRIGGQLITSDEWDDVFYVQSGGGAATLSASYSNGVVSYSFSGFQPNATVTLTVTQTGVYVTKTANSSGSGSGSFYDSDPSGTYTLQATDSYGHSASANFTFETSTNLYNFGIVIINTQAAYPGATHWMTYYDDPERGVLSDGLIYLIAQQINFTQVHNFGRLYAFLYNSSTEQWSSQITSPPIFLFGNDILELDAASGSVRGL